MYKLYAIPGTCSMGIHILLNALDQDVEIINVSELANYKAINPVGTVPLLEDNGLQIREGATIVLYLLEKHNSNMLSTDIKEKNTFLQKLFFNYATMHPAYSKLFFARNHLSDGAQTQAYQAAAEAISELWKIVDDQLVDAPFVGGDKPNILDYLLCVYANWGTFFDVDIVLGKNVTRMIKAVTQLPEFQKALNIEGVEYKAIA